MLGFSCFLEGLAQAVLDFSLWTALPIRRCSKRPGAPVVRNHRDFPWEAMILTAAFKSGYLRYGSAEDFFEAGAELIFATISAEGFMFVDAD